MFSRGFSFRRKGSDEKRRQSANTIHASPPDAIPPEQVDGVEFPSNLSRQPTLAQPLNHRDDQADPGPLGLNVVYAPDNGHKADIVFIHGLGGSSRWTWSKHQKAELFWPLTFLPLEPDVCLARILSFGYNANFRKAGNVGTAVLDFAKQLLFDLKYAKDMQKEDLNMGKVPLIFVVHSMGGLIVKEAYMQGQHDPEYEEIVKAISAITFLATPHRGTNLAVTLNRILQSTVISNSKTYISELSQNSFTLQKLNEQFRHIAPRLDIVSFYETRPTSLGVKSAKLMVLEKDSSVLGYPGETSKALDADHHGVCKYDSPQDPNYITVRNVLKSLISKIISTSRSNQEPRLNRGQSKDLKATLAISELPDVDYIFYRDQWTPGTSEWILETKTYLQWLNTPISEQHILWLAGGSATGKSVLSSFIINDLVERSLSCQYFFIRFADQKKRTLSFLLRSIAYQVAQRVPIFLARVVELADEALDIETADPKTIWERIFKSMLFKMEDQTPLYWIIDGLDEAPDTRSIIRFFSEIATSSVPIRILLVSRETSEIAAALNRVPGEVRQGTLKTEGHLQDLRCYIQQELSMFGSDEFRENVVQRVLQGSQNNFLWVRLVVEKLNSCHTHAAVEQALQKLPLGMEELYDRMAISIMENPHESDQSLAIAVLQCVTCSFRPLTVTELSQALDEDVSDMLDFQKSIVELCGGFLVIDNGGHVALVHKTAREYLLNGGGRPLSVDSQLAHEQLFLSCMQCLMSTGLRAKVNRNMRPELLDYSSTWWSSHAALLKPGSEQVASVLNRFVTGQWILTWIQTLANDQQLHILVRASKNLSKYVSHRADSDMIQAQGSQIVEQSLLEAWAIDLVKLVGKFGSSLRRNPESIYKAIPPFCPRNSALYRRFGKAEEKSILVSGLSSDDWDDLLARLSFGFGTYASSITAKGSQIAVLASSGSVSIYDSATFEEIRTSPIKHGERVYRMELNSTGSLLVTYGYKTTKVWEVSTGILKVKVANLDSRPRPLAMLLMHNNDQLLVGTDDRWVRRLDLKDPSPTWQPVAELEEPELDGHFLNAASYMALNNDGSLIAVAYRGHPLSAWEVDGPVHINHCWRARKEISRGEVIQAVWHPHTPEILGLYIEGVIFKWNPYEGEPQEMPTGAARLTMSGDGNLFATGDVHGTIKLYTTANFTLLYQLASQDTVSGMAFSPDSRRFYDIRGFYGNVWEPDALMQYAERSSKGADFTDTDSETQSLAQNSMIPLHSFQAVQSITVLSASPMGRLYCCGTEYGAVRLFDIHHGEPLDIHVSKSFFSIERLAWSDSGQYVCFSDSSKKIFVFSITPGSKGLQPLAAAMIESSVRDATKGPILQILFHPDASRLLVYTSSTVCIISLESSSIVHSRSWLLEDCTWIVHPQDSQLLLAFGAGTAKVLDWELKERGSHHFEIPSVQDIQNNAQSSSAFAVVSRVIVTLDTNHILVQMGSGQNTKEKLFLLFSSSSFSPPKEAMPPVQGTSSPLTPVVLPEYSTSHIALALSFLSQNRLIFLSTSSSICSWSIPSGPGLRISPNPATRSSSPDTTGLKHGASLRNSSPQRASMSSEKTIKEIFSLPGDWISRDCLAICSIWNKERAFLCPRNGEIAVVKCIGLI